MIARTVHANTSALKDKSIYGVVAEFDAPEKLIEAGHEVHHVHGYKKLDTLTPFPIHGIDDAIGVKPSLLGWIVICCAAFGLANAVFMIWYIGAVDYRLVIGGKPLFAWEFSMPVMFELTVLLSAFGAVIGMFALNGLPQFYHPVMNFKDIRRATDDRFLLVVEASDPRFDVVNTQRLLESLGAVHTEVVET